MKIFLTFSLIFLAAAVPTELESFCALADEILCHDNCLMGCGACNTKCTGDNHIVEIDLSSLKLSDIKSDLSGLTYVRTLLLNDNLLTEVPQSVWNMTAVENLDLSSNKIREIPTSILNMPNIFSLNLRNNKFAEMPTFLSSLTMMAHIEMAKNNIQTADCNNLPENLLWLDFSENPMTSLANIGRLKSLHYFNIESCNFFQFPTELQQLTDIRVLNIAFNKFDVYDVTLASNIRKLDIRGLNLAEIPNFALSLTQLEYLDISDNSNLRNFSFDLNNLREVRYLDVSDNDLMLLPTNINVLQKLRYVNLYASQFAGPLVRNMNLTQLTGLNMDFTQHENIPKAVFKNTRLTFFSCDSCGLKEVPSELFTLTFLRSISIKKNSLTALPNMFDKFPYLEELVIEYNELKEYPSTFNNLDGDNMKFLGAETVNCENSKTFHEVFWHPCTYYDDLEDYFYTALSFGVIDGIIVIIVVVVVVVVSMKVAKKRVRRMKNMEITSNKIHGDVVTVDTSPEKIGHQVLSQRDRWSLSKHALFFGHRDKKMDVGVMHTEEFELRNLSRAEMSYAIMFPMRKNKFTIEAFPRYGDLDIGESVKIKVNVMFHCTADIDDMLYVVVNRIPPWRLKEVKEHQTIRMKVESKISTRIDYDELQLGETIGQGSFGIVLRGMWKEHMVAIKELKEVEELTRNDFMREVDVLEAAQSPYVLRFFGAVMTMERMCLVTEYMPYGSLLGVLNDYMLSPRMKARFMLDATRGIKYLHSCHIMHRDIKSDNVLVKEISPTATVVCKISDFGSSRAVNLQKTQMKMTKGMGTPIYMAPEILQGKMNYNFSADAYSCGIMFWEIWYQDTPYKEVPLQHTWDIPNYVLAGNRPIIDDRCPTKLKELIQACWTEDHTARPEVSNIASVLEDIVNDFEKAESGQTVHAKCVHVKERESLSLFDRAQRSHEEELLRSGHGSSSGTLSGSAGFSGALAERDDPDEEKTMKQSLLSSK